MGCEIRAAEDKSYVILEFSGDLSGDSAMKSVVEANALARELGTNRFLLDVSRARNVDTPAENYSFASFKITHTEGVNTTARITALASPGDRSHNFIVQVFQNFGMDVTLFTDRHQALRHLSEDLD